MKNTGPADLHLIGKDIIRFHTIYWPIFLMALGLPLPKQVFGHPWLLQGDGKMSKSRETSFTPIPWWTFLEWTRSAILCCMKCPFENDGVITWELMVERMNSDLANILGNLVNRTVSMTNKYFGGIVENRNVCEEVDEDLKKVVLETAAKTDEKMNRLRVADAISEIFNIFRRSNKYIDETMPWTLAKDEAKKDRLATVLYNLTESIAIGASLLYSFMPSTSEKILAQLGTEKRSLKEMDTFGLYPNGNRVVEKPEILFARMDIKEVLEKVEAMKAQENAKSGAPEANAAGASQEANNAAQDGAESGSENGAEDGMDVEKKPEITYDDFSKLQFQIGEIVKCEEVPKSKKLLCSQVKIGSETRQILSGIKAWYKPEDMVGRRVMVVTNLKPAKLAGMMSEGMILCAEDDEGNLSLMVPEKKIKSGSEVR